MSFEELCVCVYSMHYITICLFIHMITFQAEFKSDYRTLLLSILSVIVLQVVGVSTGLLLQYQQA